MNNNIKLDLKDRKILYELDINARQSYSEIGKKVGLSKEVVNYRIKSLLNIGLIKSFFTIIDTSKLGYLSFRIFLKFQNTTIDKENEIIEYLKKQNNVGWIVSVKGNWDLNFVAWQKNAYEFEEFFDNLMNKYKFYIDKQWFSIITKLYHYRRAYLLDKKEDSSGYVIVGGSIKSKTDDIDLKILNMLAFNSRLGSLEIAGKIKTTEKIVRDRIKKLIKERVILGFRALFDLNLLGYEYYKLHLTLNKFEKEDIKNLLGFIHYHPNIIYYTKTIGGADFELDIQIKNHKFFYKLIREIRNNFTKIIKDFEFMQYDEEYKLIYLPET